MIAITIYIVVLVNPNIAQPLNNVEWLIPSMGLFFWSSFLAPLLAYKIAKNSHSFIHLAGTTAWNLILNLVVLSSTVFLLAIFVFGVICGISGNSLIYFKIGDYPIGDCILLLWLVLQVALILTHLVFSLVGAGRAAYGQSSTFPLLRLVK